MEYNINKGFNKSSLIKVFYDGDFNGTGIDFKNDGSYIFDNSAIGLSDYQYGKYKIQKDTITLDKSPLDNVITTEKLVIREKEIEYSGGARREKYLYQVGDDGQIIEGATEFRVVVDNRKN